MHACYIWRLRAYIIWLNDKLKIVALKWIKFVKKTNFMHNLFLVHFINRCIFRAHLSIKCCIHTVVPPDDGPRYVLNIERLTKYTNNKLCIELVFLHMIISIWTVNKTQNELICHSLLTKPIEYRVLLKLIDMQLVRKFYVIFETRLD